MESHRLKLDRALEHLNTVNTFAQLFVESEAWAIVSDCEVESREHSVRIGIFRQPNDPRIGLAVGDCIHNLRQGLDHLGYRLAIAVHGIDPPPNEATTGFPITTSPERFIGGLGQKIGPKKKMSDDLFGALEELQPYPGRSQLLWALHQLDNLDKHRFPPVVAAVSSVPRFELGDLTVSNLKGPFLGPLENGDPIFQYTPVEGTNEIFSFRADLTLGFGKETPVVGGQFVPHTLQDIRNYILREVFPKLERFI